MRIGRPSVVCQVVTLGLLLLAPRASALELQVEVGLEGLVVDGGWAPVVVRCTLAADEAVFDGRLVVLRPREMVGRVEAPLRLEPGTSTTVRLPVLASPGMAYVVRALDAGGRVVAEGAPRGALTMLLPDERLVVVCGPVGAAALASVPASDRPRIARLRPEELPRDAHVLANAAAVLLEPSGGDSAHVELARDPAVVAMLERYVRSGGTLVLLPGAGAFWTETPLDALAPARVEGRGAEQAGVFEALLGVTEGADPTRSVPVLTCTPRAGARVVWAGELHPLVVDRALGRGRVVLVAFDPDREGLRGASRASTFLLALLASEADPVSPFRHGDAEELLAAVLDATPPLGTGWFYGLALVAAVHVLGVSLLTTIVARRRGPWAGLALPPLISIGLAAVLLVAGALGRGSPRVTTLALEVHDGSRGDVARVHGAVGVAAGGPTSVWVELPPALRPAAQQLSGLDLLRPRGRAVALRERAGRPALVGPIEVAAHGRSTLALTGLATRDRADDAALLGGLRVRANVVPALVDAAGGAVTPELWPRVQVTNTGEAPLEGLFVLALGPSSARLIAVEPLAPGQQVMAVPAPAHTLAPPLPPSLGAQDLLADRALLLERAARCIEASWVRALSAAATGPLQFPTAWVLHARVEDAALVPVLATEEGPELPGRTVRITCVPAEEP